MSTSNCCASLTCAWRMSWAASMRPPVKRGHSILTELVTTFCLVRGVTKSLGLRLSACMTGPSTLPNSG
ncbi:hypothetical protein D3C72_2222780 [compost metagenome]